MWSFNRRSFLIGTAALAGCGYSPVFGPDGAGSKLFGKISFETPASTETYALVRYLEERMGVSEAPSYGLSYSVSVRQEGLAVTVRRVIARYNVLGTMSFSLRDLSDNRVVSSGKVTAMTGYSATGSTVATRAASNDARERLMMMLADRMIDHLVVDLGKSAE